MNIINLTLLAFSPVFILVAVGVAIIYGRKIACGIGWHIYGNRTYQRQGITFAEGRRGLVSTTQHFKQCCFCQAIKHVKEPDNYVEINHDL